MKDGILLVFIGAGLASAIFGLIFLGIKVRDFLREFVGAMKGVGKLAGVMQKLVDIGTSISMELQLLRSIMASNAGPNIGPEPSSAPAAGGSPGGRPLHPFPAPNMDIYRDVPDAKIEDTIIDETDDAQMAENEQLEAVRDKGFEVET